MIAVELVFFFYLALALPLGLGFLVNRALPREWRAYTVVLAPLVGYALLSLIGYYAVRTVLNLAWFFRLLLFLVLLVVIWVEWARRREKRARREAAAAAGQGKRAPLRGEWAALGLPEHGPAWLLTLAAILLAVLPLLSYGYSVPIGENWDPENYLPITAYLRQVPVGRLMEMPPNPLRDLNAFPPRIGMTLGFCILQGTLGSLPGPGGWDALGTFAPTIALLHGLTVLAWYALLRIGFGLGRWAGTIAAALAGLSALALWIAFFNFGMQMAAMPLVPLALTLWLLALRHPSWRTVLLAGLAAAALPVAYYPALTVFVPLALGLGLHEVIRRWLAGAAPHLPAAPREAAPPNTPAAARAKRALPVLAAGLAAAALSVVLAGGPILDYGQGFSFRYGQQMTTLGLFHFPSLAQLLGLAPFSRTPETLPALWAGLAAVLPWLVVAAAAAALLPRRPRWIWAAALVPALFYLAWLRGWFLPLAEALRLPAELVERFRPYPYAFLKGAVFVVPFFWGAAAASWERLWSWLAKRPAGRAALVGLLLIPLGLLLAADARLVARYWGRPAHFDAAALQVREAVRMVPSGAEVYLTGRPERSRVTLGLFAYLLLDHPVQGRLSTGYGGYDRRLPGGEPAYALLDAADNPLPLGFFATDAVWAGGGMVLYQRSPDIVSFLDLRDDAYTGRDPGEVHTREPLVERLLQSFGRYPPGLLDEPAIGPVLAGQPGRAGLSGPVRYPAAVAQSLRLGPLFLYVDAGRISRQPDLPGAAGRGALLVAFASLEPAVVVLHWTDGTTETCALPAGFSTCRSRPRALPDAAELRLAYGVNAWPCWAALVEEGGAPGVEPRPEAFLLLPSAGAADSTLQVELNWHGDGSRPLRLALEVWENTFDAAQHYAWWGPLPLPVSGTVRLRADLGAREATAWLGEEESAFPAHPGADAWPEAADGAYFAALWVYYGGQVVEVVPVGRFTIAGGQVQGLEPLQPGLRLVWPHSPAEASGARFGEPIELAAYALPSRTFSPGGGVPLALEWHALEAVAVDYMVTVQLLRDGRLEGQWDGPAGQWYGATSWRPGQFVRDDIPLRIPEDAAPGRYRLIVALYDPATGTRLPVRLADGPERGDFLDLGELLVR